MVTDKQVRRLRKLSNTEKNQEIAASKAGMDPKTARRYLGLERLPSELKKERPWRTREDPFGEVWVSMFLARCFNRIPYSCWRDLRDTPTSILFQHEDVLLCADLLQDFRPYRDADLTQVGLSEQ